MPTIWAPQAAFLIYIYIYIYIYLFIYIKSTSTIIIIIIIIIMISISCIIYINVIITYQFMFIIAIMGDRVRHRLVRPPALELPARLFCAGACGRARACLTGLRESPQRRGGRRLCILIN